MWFLVVWRGFGMAARRQLAQNSQFEYKQRNNLAADVQQFGPDLGTVS